MSLTETEFERIRSATKLDAMTGVKLSDKEFLATVCIADAAKRYWSAVPEAPSSLVKRLCLNESETVITIGKMLDDYEQLNVRYALEAMYELELVQDMLYDYEGYKLEEN